ncbi:hypothetical protein GW17_00043704 [Ensete ventricosum]|nr:hypothetical protein GW17_00043704 [Ensete ventricosum]
MEMKPKRGCRAAGHCHRRVGRACGRYARPWLRRIGRMESIRSVHGLGRGGRGEEKRESRERNHRDPRGEGEEECRPKEIEKSDKTSYAHSSGSDSIVGIRFAWNRRYRLYAFNGTMLACGLVPSPPFPALSRSPPLPHALPRNCLRSSNSRHVLSQWTQNRGSSRTCIATRAAVSRGEDDDEEKEGEGDGRSPGAAKGSGTSARGRRLLKVREEKRKRESDRIHNYPSWAKSVEERVRTKGRDFRKSKTGSVLAFKVSFRDIKVCNTVSYRSVRTSPKEDWYAWLFSHALVEIQEPEDINENIAIFLYSICVVSLVWLKLSLICLLQLANSSMDYNPLYNSDNAVQSMSSSFHDIGDVEFQDNWGRVWSGSDSARDRPHRLLVAVADLPATSASGSAFASAAGFPIASTAARYRSPSPHPFVLIDCVYL